MLALCFAAKCAIGVAGLFLLAVVIVFLCGWSLYNEAMRENEELLER